MMGRNFSTLRLSTSGSDSNPSKRSSGGLPKGGCNIHYTLRSKASNSDFDPPRTTPEKISRTLFLVGKTGHGKSSTGNSILGRQEFKTSSGGTSETKKVCEEWVVNDRYELHVIDGPGIPSTDLNKVEDAVKVCNDMITAMTMCNGGVDAFLLTIKFGTRMTKEEVEAILCYKNVFGNDFFKDHGIIVITCGESFDSQMEADGMKGKSFDEWCQDCGGELKGLIEECENRVVLFSNVAKDDETKKSQKDKLLKYAEDISQQKGLYTNEHFKSCAKLRNDMINKTNILLKEEIQKEFSQLRAKIKNLTVNLTPDDIKSLETHITNIQKNNHPNGDPSLTRDLEKIKEIIENLKIARRENNIVNISKYIEALKGTVEIVVQKIQIAWKKIICYTLISVAGVVVVGAGALYIVCHHPTILACGYDIFKTLCSVSEQLFAAMGIVIKALRAFATVALERDIAQFTPAGAFGIFFALSQRFLLSSER